MTTRGQHERNDQTCECGKLYCTNCHDACPECLGIHLAPQTGPHAQPELGQEWVKQVKPIDPPFQPWGTYTKPGMGTGTDPEILAGNTTIGNADIEATSKALELIGAGDGKITTIVHGPGPLSWSNGPVIGRGHGGDPNPERPDSHGPVIGRGHDCNY